MNKDTVKPTKFNRNTYDLSCYNAVCGQIGRLQTLFTIPVYANDTIDINLIGALRLSELKRYLTLDCKVDTFAFYVKHRFIYGSTWEDMVMNGMQDATVLPTDTATYHTMDFLGGTPPGTIPKAYNEGYYAIWNDYFRIPNVTPTPKASMNLTHSLDQDEYRWGELTARLPSFWNTGVPATNIDAVDYQEVVPNAGGNIELLDIANVQAQYKDQVDLEWFGHRYRDVLANKHGSQGVSIDADERPELLMHNESWLSGYDVDGTDAQTLGNYKGKSQGTINLRVPPKYFNEHGMIWVMMVIRFPSILQEEKHYLMHHTWDYETIMGDPNIWNIKPPIELSEDDFHGLGGSDSWGVHPYGQWARTQPNRIHQRFHGLEGFPFIAENTIDLWDLHYDGEQFGWPGAPDTIDYFGNEDLGHWNLISKAEITAKRNIPTARKSLYAGS